MEEVLKLVVFESVGKPAIPNIPGWPVALS